MTTVYELRINGVTIDKWPKSVMKKAGPAFEQAKIDSPDARVVLVRVDENVVLNHSPN